MATKKRKPKTPDPAAFGFDVMQHVIEATGDTPVEPGPAPDLAGKDPAAVALGRKGGLKGGPARAKKLGKKKLSEIGKGEEREEKREEKVSGPFSDPFLPTFLRSVPGERGAGNERKRVLTPFLPPHFIKIPNLSDDESAIIVELYPLFLTALTALTLIAVWCIIEFLSMFVLRDEDRSEPVPSRGELARLIKLKRRGSLLRRSWLVRKLALKTSHCTPGVNTGIEERPPQPRRPEKALDRLLRLKQAGAWNRRDFQAG